MDADVAQAIAELRGQLGQLRAALGVQDTDAAQAEVADLRNTVAALAEWGATVSPPFALPAVNSSQSGG